MDRPGLGRRFAAPRRRVAACLVTGLVVFVATGLFGVSAGAGDELPVILGWSVTNVPGCGCVDSTLVVRSTPGTTARIDWGATPSLGSQTSTVTLTAIDGQSGETLRWQPAPPAGDYYLQLVVSNDVGSTLSPVMPIEIGTDGRVTPLPPILPPPPRPTPPHPYAMVTVTPSAPAVVVVGDSITFSVTTWLSPIWSSGIGERLGVVLPGNNYVVVAPSDFDPAFDVDQLSTTAGSCVMEIECDFGDLPGGSAPVVTFTLRAKKAGSYRMVVNADHGTAVTIPVTVVDRQADLSVASQLGLLKLTPKLGRWTQEVLAISNSGPNVVNDALVTVGVPHQLQVHATIAGGTCTPTPIRCTAPTLAPGQTIRLMLTTRATRLGSFGIPIGVSSAAARDANPGNNTLHLKDVPHR